MRDQSHSEKVRLWAEYVRDHPNEWRKQLNPFIDSQIQKANRFYEKLAETPKGKQKIEEIKKLRYKTRKIS